MAAYSPIPERLVNPSRPSSHPNLHNPEAYPIFSTHLLPLRYSGAVSRSPIRKPPSTSFLTSSMTRLEYEMLHSPPLLLKVRPSRAARYRRALKSPPSVTAPTPSRPRRAILPPTIPSLPPRTLDRELLLLSLIDNF